MKIRKSSDRGHLNFGWLDTYHSFSFGEYYDPEYMGFGSLRVINEDKIAPNSGFPTHPHRDMEIVTYLLEGSLEHKDSMGNGSTITAGQVQQMSAGTGVSHSEFNPSGSETTHLFQIWIQPDRAGYAPSYDQRTIDPESVRGRFGLIASPDGAEESVRIHQSARIRLARLGAGETIELEILPHRQAWIHLARGRVEIGKAMLDAGDAVGAEGAERIVLAPTEESEVLWFDLG